MPTRQASAVWNGDLPSGKGRMEFEGYSGPYSFISRFESGSGTNPEELLGAAHAGCYSMALSNMLAKAGFPADEVSTTAEVTLEVGPDGPSITNINLICRAQVPGVTAAAFAETAEAAKTGCPVSKALAATDITLDAALV